MSPDRTRRLAYAAWGAVCIIWGTTYLAIKVCLETVPPTLMGGLRYTIAGALLLGLLVAMGERLPARTSWPGLALLGVLMIGVGNSGVVWAEVWIPSGITAVVVASTPFWMVGIEALMPSGERPRPWQVAGLAIGFSGIVLLVWEDLTAGGAQARNVIAGLAALQIASAGWALGSSYSRRHARHENALAAASFEMIAGGLAMLAVGTLLGEWPRLAFTGTTATAFTYLVVAGAIGGFASYIYALKHLPVTTVSLYAYANPVIAVVLGSLLLGEAFDVRMAAAVLVILLGIALVQFTGRAPAPGAGAVDEAA
jgi:drug/metabolite transporter (DMT)-like permease